MDMHRCRMQVMEYMKKYRMADRGDGILAAVSGGADSICLFWLLHDLAEIMGFRLAVFHLNHGLRGAEADRDERYVQGLCDRLQIPCCTVREDVRAYAREHGMSEEEAGRTLRYHYMREAAERFSCSKIATAHHKDDGVETVLMNLFRGTGLRGLGGIRAVRSDTGPSAMPNGQNGGGGVSPAGITIIRPMLCLTRKEIEGYLKERQIPWCEDSTNRELKYARNKVRNVLVPWVKEEINEQAVDHILQLASLASQADEYFVSQAAMLLGEEPTQIAVDIFDAQPEILKQYLVRTMLAAAAGQEKDISSKHVEAVCALTGPGGGIAADLPYGLRAVRGYEMLEIRRKADILAPALEKQEILLETRVFPWKKDLEIPKNQCTKWFDYDKIKGTLCVRTRESGDYFLYSGDKRKLLKRYFIDEKVPEERRDQIPLLTEGNHVLWIIGHRISEYYKITDNTCTILEVRLCKGEKNG